MKSKVFVLLAVIALICAPTLVLSNSAQIAPVAEDGCTGDDGICECRDGVCLQTFQCSGHQGECIVSPVFKTCRCTVIGTPTEDTGN